MPYRARARSIQRQTCQRQIWHPWGWMSFLCAVCLTLGVLSHAAAADTQMRRKVIDEGRQDFAENCAACHAADGSGTGELSAHLIRPAKDLTAISARNGGAFPFWQVFEIISGPRDVSDAALLAAYARRRFQAGLSADPRPHPRAHALSREHSGEVSGTPEPGRKPVAVGIAA